MKATVVRSSISTSLVVACLALAGCSHDHPPAATSGITETNSSRVATGSHAPATMGVSDDLVAACKIDFGNVDTAPKFDFDESALDSGERGVLDQIAKCVTTGPMRGKQLKLVGRADPRGEQEYNMALGSQRAATVKKYLLADGVAAAGLITTSRGKLDASGTDETSWQRDRRVDIDLE